MTEGPRPFLRQTEAVNGARSLKAMVETMQDDPDLVFEFARSGVAIRQRMVQNMLFGEYGNTVQAGPFVGMELMAMDTGSVSIPRLLGCYEEELHDLVRGMDRYRRVVNVGSAEGWYAVGLARLFPALEVIAYDINALARRVCAEMAERNGVAGRIDQRVECTPADLERLAEPGTVILMDIEGAEADLLGAVDPARAARCDWIIETHRVDASTTLDGLLARFSGTHDIEIIEQRARSPEAYPLLRGLGQLDRFLAQWEGRGAEPWVVMRGRS